MRWQPDGRGRLEVAALALYSERGFDNTTVAEIAARAGLTERTFYRYFADKREVLFWGGDALAHLLVEAVGQAPGSATPVEAAAFALQVAGAHLQERREFARLRQATIAANAELRERELIKLASLAAALAEALRQRGVPDPAASLTGEVAMAVFRLGFERWVDGPDDRELPQVLGDAFLELRQLTA